MVYSRRVFSDTGEQRRSVEELIDTFTENNAKEDRYEISVASCVFKGREIKAKTEGREILLLQDAVLSFPCR